jgi:hypothetical protein
MSNAKELISMDNSPMIQIATIRAEADRRASRVVVRALPEWT